MKTTKDDEELARVDHSQYDPSSTRPSATASTAVAGSDHSPLPWMRGIDVMNGTPVPNYVVDRNRRPIADRGIFSFHDADLIVRAVNAHEDLLAALKALFEDYKRLADSGDAGNWSLEGLAVGQQALAAIAKAEQR